MATAAAPTPMAIIRSVKQQVGYSPPQEGLLELLEDFRLMVNDCIRMGLEKEEQEGIVITSMRKLSLTCYHQLAAYDLPAYYRLTAISRAAGILRNYRREKKGNPNTKRPYAERHVLTDCYGFRIFGRLLRIPFRRKREYIFIILNDHTMKMLSGRDVRSITLSPDSLSISYSRDVVQIQPQGAIGIDRNLDNITTADTIGSIRRYGSLVQATRIKAKIRQIKIRFTRNDTRIRKKVHSKYGTLQRNRVNHVLSNVSSRIVKRAQKNKLAIIIEDIKGIRKLYRKGNGQGKNYRAVLNSWSYYELQRQIAYKARWEGLPVIYVPARGTSAGCSICGSKTIPNESRTLYCPNCKVSFDRDENAARNILAKRCGGLGMPVEIPIPMRFEPNCSAGEAMVTEREGTTLIRPVDGGKITREVSA